MDPTNAATTSASTAPAGPTQPPIIPRYFTSPKPIASLPKTLEPTAPSTQMTPAPTTMPSAETTAASRRSGHVGGSHEGATGSEPSVSWGTSAARTGAAHIPG